MKIDTSQIQGFEEMSPEEKVAALTGFEYSDNSEELAKLKKEKENLKKLNEEANSTIASYKKKEKDSLSESEKTIEELTESNANLQKELSDLKKQTTVAQYKARYMAQGYDEKLAEETASALAEGDMETVFNNGEKFKGILEKELKADNIKNLHAPDSKGGAKPPKTKAEIMAIKDFEERQRLIAEHQELFTRKD